MNNDDDLCSDDAVNELELLFSLSVSCIIRTEDPERFLRWFRDCALEIAPEFLNHALDDPDALRSLLAILGREIWNKTPLPWNQFRPRPLPKPERNALCICGSGRKYKQCCVRAEQMDEPFGQLSLLPFVLDSIPAKARKSLPYSYLNPEELAFVAKQWMEVGREKEAISLLEGLFADFSKLDQRADIAFDCLLDGYDLLNKPLKKKRLLEQGLTAPDKYLRATAMQRQCCILADRNEFAKGWALFQELQRLIPNDPSLSHLEIVMLLGQGEKHRAAERAKFWVARLTRDANVSASLLDFLRSVAKGDATGAMTSIAKEADPILAKLIEMIAHLPKTACHYRLEPMDDSAGPLMPDA
ncbi:MAG: SEC-C metal-binding domain-containing protein, partial [Gallionellaceae bacterium]